MGPQNQYLSYFFSAGIGRKKLENFGSLIPC